MADTTEQVVVTTTGQENAQGKMTDKEHELLVDMMKWKDKAREFETQVSSLKADYEGKLAALNTTVGAKDTEIATLKTQHSESLSRMEQVMQKEIDANIEALPESAREFAKTMVGKGKSIEEKMEILSEMKKTSVFAVKQVPVVGTAGHKVDNPELQAAVAKKDPMAVLKATRSK